ncbi:hypothetical protein A2U01_0094560 [Trifolium medium]|uniref:Uncharacterized protein n=1 Tax=Trifolium medium TaxID=97028 RepID=A0A392ULH4_9FABA|nr:hypothetical protein [Trifolium medium]
MSNNNDGNLNPENPNHRPLNRTQQATTLSLLEEMNSSARSNNKVHRTDDGEHSQSTPETHRGGAG